MERQKIFWVVLSVSVFVVVVLVVGVFLLGKRPPAAAAAPGSVSPISDPGTQIYEYQREAPLPQPGANGASAATSGGDETQTMHFYIGEGEGNATSEAGTRNGSTPSESGSPAPQPAAATKPPASSTPKAASAAPPARATTKKTVEYWIQTGSYKSQTKAEELAAFLGAKGLAGRVFSYVSKSETFYRVRVGPYAIKGEAEKFLSIVKKLQGLDSSYISQVASTRTVN
jgi:cell division protein FtsN